MSDTQTKSASEEAKTEQPTVEQLTGMVEKGANLIKQADATITELREDNAKKAAEIKKASDAQAAVAEISGPIVDSLIEIGIIPAEKKAQAVEAMGDPIKVAKQLEQVLTTMKTASVGSPSDTLSDDTGDDMTAKAADQRYLQATEVG